MRRSSLAVRVVLLIVSIIALTALVHAQYGASLEGTVTDKSGAVVAGATVTITNQATGVSRNSVTGDSGFYRITGLPPGRYKVEVEAPSFKKSSTPNVDVLAETVNAANVILDTGSASETVSVTASTTEELEAESANIGGTVTSQQAVDLPEFGRDPYTLLRVTPGVFADASRQGNGNSLAIPQQVGPGGSNSQFSRRKTRCKPSLTGSASPPTILCWMESVSIVWSGVALRSLPLT